LDAAALVPILAPVAAVLAALIAGAFSYFNLVTAKETKVSEFRQHWIDGLRSEISTFISRIHMLFALEEYGQKLEDGDYIRDRSQLEQEARAAYAAIRLRINRDEKKQEAKDINEHFLNRLEDALECYNAREADDIGHCLDTLLVESAHKLLKYEWDRVRVGEKAYRRAKGIAIALVTLALMMFGAFIYMQYERLHPKPVAANAVEQSDGLRDVPSKGDPSHNPHIIKSLSI